MQKASGFVGLLSNTMKASRQQENFSLLSDRRCLNMLKKKKLRVSITLLSEVYGRTS
jgi:hypothetical protein